MIRNDETVFHEEILLLVLVVVVVVLLFVVSVIVNKVQRRWASLPGAHTVPHVGAYGMLCLWAYKIMCMFSMYFEAISTYNVRIGAIGGTAHPSPVCARQRRRPLGPCCSLYGT